MSNSWLETPSIEIRLMNDEHRDQVFELVIDTFFRDEPLNRCLEFDIPEEPIEFTDWIISSSVRDQCSFVAVDRQIEKVIGVVLNQIEHRPNLDDQDCFNETKFQSEKLRYVFNVLHSVHRNIDLFDQMKTDQLLHIAIVAIDVNYRGLRLTEKLIRSSIERAKNDLHLVGAYAEATSSFSSRAFLKQGFQIYDEIIYAKFDVIRLASLDGEHDRCQLVAKEL